MKLIGLSGKARSGKSTVAGMLVKNYGFTEIALADPLKRLCFEVFGGKMTERHLWGNGRDEPIAELGGLTARRALQTLGTEWARGCYPDVWIDYALGVMARVATPAGMHASYWYDPRHGVMTGSLDPLRAFPRAPTPLSAFVISDVRFMNEAAAIRKAGGEVWRIVRPDVGLEGGAAAHISENELPETRSRFTCRNYKSDAAPENDFYRGVIANNGDFAKFERNIRFLVDEIVSDENVAATAALPPFEEE